MDLVIGIVLNFGPVVLLLVLGYSAGTYLERRHYDRIRRRESETTAFPVVTLRSIPIDWRVESCRLVMGGVVVSIDYFKRFLASLQLLVGGRLTTYEPVLDRGRREALLRMKQAAMDQGYDAVINVRLETSRLANSTGGGTARVEMLAFGTAVCFAQDS